jgi:hypothetical protein
MMSFDVPGGAEGGLEDEESIDESEKCTECCKHAEEACEIYGPECEDCDPDMWKDEDGCT